MKRTVSPLGHTRFSAIKGQLGAHISKEARGKNSAPSPKQNGSTANNKRPAAHLKQRTARPISLKTKEIKEIRFYRANEKPYGAFSNLYGRNIVFEGRQFPTAEHAYQAGKPKRDEVREWILDAPTPALLAMAAHGLYTWDIVPNWSEIKYDRMGAVLRAKFTQHEDLRELLLQTGEARLVEAGRVPNTVNRTWGEVGGKGLNILGQLLMELRTQLRTEHGQDRRTKKAVPA